MNQEKDTHLSENSFQNIQQDWLNNQEILNIPFTQQFPSNQSQRPLEIQASTYFIDTPNFNQNFPFGVQGPQNLHQRLNDQQIPQPPVGQFTTIQENQQPKYSSPTPTLNLNPKEIFNQTIAGNKNNQQIQELNSQIKQLRDQNKELEDQLKQSKIDKIDKVQELQKQINMIQQQLEDSQLKHGQSETSLDIRNNQIQYLIKQIDSLNIQLDGKVKLHAESLSSQKIAQEQNSCVERIKNFFEPKESVIDLQQQILTYKQTIAQQEQQLKIQKYTQQDMDNMQNSIDKEHQNFLEARDEIANLNKTIQQLRNDIHRKDQERDNVYDQLQIKKKVCREMETENKQKDFELQKKLNEISFLQKAKDMQQTLLQEQIKFGSTKKVHVIETQLKEDEKKFEEQQKNLSQQMEIELQKDEEKKKQFEQEIKKRTEIQRRQQIEQKNKNSLLLKNIVSNSKVTHGQLDVCFLLDVTGSMDPYKEQTQKCVEKSLQMIKQLTGRDVNWASICYQDKDELKKMGRYFQFEFSKDSNQLQEWFGKIKCDGGDDKAEDINGAIIQMLKLNWSSKFKIAILICDSPCHGKKYNGGCFDRHPNDDIKPAIEELISKEILLMGLNFTKDTLKMYEEFKNIFIEKNKQDLFMYTDLKHLGTNLASADSEIAKWLGQASQQSTQITNKSSKVKNDQQPPDVPRMKDGAMEALCKQGNFQNFEVQPNIKTVQVKFDVHKIEIKEEAFEQHLQDISSIIVPLDYLIQKEGVWDCIRTEQPFAQGMVKDVYLMKKITCNSELYVIKTPISSMPYKSINDAISECRSHLISQRLMKKFQNDIEITQNKKGKNFKYPNVVYSDFLILEESPTKYWIAERYFKGEFVKYNNNFGFIDEETTELNKLAQAFTFYTYYISGFNYMVTDIQGVEIYFTDPAINTIKGTFDNTDMGEDGISMYLVNYEMKKQFMSKEILTLLDMYE